MSKEDVKLTKKETKKLFRVIYIFLAFLFVGVVLHSIDALYYAFNPISPAEYVRKHTKDPSKVTKHVRLSGVDYDIPVGYFVMHVPYAIEDSLVYLRFMKDDLSILPKSEVRLFKDGRRDSYLSVLAYDPIHIKDLDSISISVLERAHHTNVPAHKIYGLQTYSPMPGKENEGFGEPFTYKKDGHFVTVIKCSADRAPPIPGSRASCSHDFTDGYLIYNTKYAKNFLPHWQEYEEKIKVLFKSFRDSARKKNLKAIIVRADQVDRMLTEYRKQPINPNFKTPQGE